MIEDRIEATRQKTNAAERRADQILNYVMVCIIAFLLVAVVGTVSFVYWRVGRDNSRILAEMTEIKAKQDVMSGKLKISPREVFDEVQRLNEKVNELKTEIAALKRDQDKE